MTVWRVVLRLSDSLHELGDVEAIGATGFGRRAGSRHYGKRIKYYFRAVEATILLDCETNVILAVHCSMKQPHDPKIGWQVLARNLDILDTITGDEGYDWDDLREKLRAHDIRPVIKKAHWQFDRDHNARLDDDVYHLRSNVDSAFFALTHRFGETLRARTWFGQFSELVLMAAVRTIELAVRA